MLKDEQKSAKTLPQRLAGLNKERGAWGENLACGVAWQGVLLGRSGVWQGVVNLATHNTAWRGEFGNETAQQSKMGAVFGRGTSLSLSLSRRSHLWHAFALNLKGFFTHFVVVSSRFIVDFTHFIAILSRLIVNFSYFIVVLSRIFAYKRHFLGHCAFLKFLNALFLGFCALFVILSILQKGDPTGCKAQSHKSALNSLLKLNFRLR